MTAADRHWCPGSGMYVGLVVGHRDLCVDCGRRIRVAKDHRLERHLVPVGPDGEPIKKGQTQ